MFEATTRRLSTLPDMMTSQQRERRPSIQDVADSAMHFLERRRSSDQGLGSIQPDLYRRRGSIVRNESTSGLPIGICDLKMKYDFSRSDFHISVVDVRRLTRIDHYFIRISLSGHKEVHQTGKLLPGATLKKEDFKFALSYDELLEKTLLIQLLGARKPGSGCHSIGEVSMKMSAIDPSDEVFLSTDLDTHEADDNQGQLFLGVQFLPSAERLVVTVHQAKDLPSHESLPNAYVKVFLLQSGRVVKKRKSQVRKNSQSPIWNEALNFTLSPSSLSSCQLEIDVLDYDRVGNDRLLGQISLGAESCEKLWKDVLEGKSVNPKWISLRYL
ncbi:hypothetical protein PFISCL1PPCAC_7995 [Pristionchus fissidentatus]|uniref:C2 domain-containing protein n=1 Tax=Pristionchus fissidentatus TaxID=1538716 RepID=A0AAV5VBR4_9BILA|nr:hypothetical protein PFISCL1PPCAC_7995 [Pristionchus fissidentatus]